MRKLVLVVGNLAQGRNARLRLGRTGRNGPNTSLVRRVDRLKAHFELATRSKPRCQLRLADAALELGDLMLVAKKF